MSELTMKATLVTLVAKGGYSPEECDKLADQYVKLANSMEPRTEADLELIALFHKLMAM